MFINKKILEKLITKEIVKCINESLDMSNYGGIEYELYIDDDEYEEYLEDNDLQDSPTTKMNYVTDDNVMFSIDFLNQYYHFDHREDMFYSDLIDNFDERVAKIILDDCLKNEKGSLDVEDLYDDYVDLDNPNSINDFIVKVLPHGDYFKDCRGFILTNGEVVYCEQEHNQCTIVPGVKGTAHFISLGNIRLLPNSIDIGQRPTQEQLSVLYKVVKSYAHDELYIDMENENQTENKAYNPTYVDFVMDDIESFYDL